MARTLTAIPFDATPLTTRFIPARLEPISFAPPAGTTARTALVGLRDGLVTAEETLTSGKVVETIDDAAIWLLEQLAAAADE